MKPKIMEFMLHAIIMPKYLLECNKTFRNNRIQHLKFSKHPQHINPQISTPTFLI